MVYCRQHCCPHFDISSILYSSILESIHKCYCISVLICIFLLAITGMKIIAFLLVFLILTPIIVCYTSIEHDRIGIRTFDTYISRDPSYRNWDTKGWIIMLRTRRYGEDTIENKEDDLKNVIIFVANLNEDGIFRNIVSFV